MATVESGCSIHWVADVLVMVGFVCTLAPSFAVVGHQRGARTGGKGGRGEVCGQHVRWELGVGEWV